jgi:glutamate dehydrogenase/leucine dehydrogenase
MKRSRRSVIGAPYARCDVALSISLDSSIDDFRALLEERGTSRAFFVGEGGEGLKASHDFLEPLARAITLERDFDAHEGLFFEVGKDTSSLLSAFLHRTIRGQGAGGVRHWPYGSIGDLVRDGLRLSRGMGRKNALAGLYWGGGKGIIARRAGGHHKDVAYRKSLYSEYGRFVTSLRGAYVTAEDVGTTPPDMAAIFSTTRFVTCIPPNVGGSGNPSPATAKGVVCAMEAALDHIDAGGLAGKRIAMQGVGNVGSSMIANLLERGVASIVGTDIDADQCSAQAARFAGAPVRISVVARGDTSIFGEECDVFAPNALGAILNPSTSPKLRCKVVCGAANNQLEDDHRDDRALHARGILYVPDFVANRMGIVSCANEQYGSLPNDPVILRHFGREWENSVYLVTRKILEHARVASVTTTEAANVLADALSLEPHPLFPHRSRALIDALVVERWHDGPGGG